MSVSISVAMATYNGVKYISAQLDSISAQTCPPDEIIICDDNSLDGTIEIVEQFARSTSIKVSVYRNAERLGYTKNFEIALSLCNGDVIFLSDQDDFWLPDKIVKALEVFRLEPTTFLVINDMTIADKNLLPSRYSQLETILLAGGRASDFRAGCCMAVRSSFLELVLPFPSPVFTHDNWINQLAVALDVRKLVPDPLQLYRRHGENASNSLLSRPQSASQLGLFRASGLTSAAAGWQDQLDRYRITHERLAGQKSWLERLGIENRQQDALRSLDRLITNLEARLALASEPRLLRWPHVIALLLSGGYADFAGWKSAVKDLIRP